MKLTIKQENFCNYYLETGNASEAYRKAYNAEKMKEESITVNASKLLTHTNIALRVQQLQKVLQDRSDITKSEAIKELTHIVRSRVTNVLTAKGKSVVVKSLSELPDDVVACISSIKSVKGGIEVRFYNKIDAIDRLSKLLGWNMPEVKDVNIISQFETWSDDEIREFITETFKTK